MPQNDFQFRRVEKIMNIGKPKGIYIYDNFIWLTDGLYDSKTQAVKYVIRKISITDGLQLEWQISGPLQGPRGIGMDQEHCLYVSDTGHNRIVKFDKNGQYIRDTTINPEPSTGSLLLRPYGLIIQNKKVFVCDRDNHCIKVFNLNLNLQFSSEPHELQSPTDISCLHNNDDYIYYVVGAANCEIITFCVEDDRSIKVLSRFKEIEGISLKQLRGISIHDDYIYVTDIHSDKVLCFTAEKKRIYEYKAEHPIALAVHQGMIYFTTKGRVPNIPLQVNILANRPGFPWIVPDFVCLSRCPDFPPIVPGI